MTTLELRPEFRGQHMQDTAIELSNRQNTGWTQRSVPDELLDISYPTFDVQRAILAVSASNAVKPVVLLGQRGSGKSHIMALLHYAFSAPDAVET
jgi:chromosomal replication initiation ATPase DnaA